MIIKINKNINNNFFYRRLNKNTSVAPLLESSERISYIASTPNLTSINLLNVTTSDLTTSEEDALFTYLNTPSSSPEKIIETVKSSSATSSLFVEHPTDDTDSELSLHNDRISPTGNHVSIDMIPKILDDKNDEINTEDPNLHISNEIQIIHDKNLNVSITDTLQNGIY